MTDHEVASEEFSPREDASYPELPEQATEEMRLRLRQKALDDFYFFCKSVLGYDRIRPDTHGALCRFLQTCRFIRRMVQLPRSHFKTTIATIAHSMWLVCHNPEERILLVASTATNAENFLREIRNHFQFNEFFKWLFPEIIPKDWSKVRANAQNFQVPRSSFFREPTFDTIGAGGAVESRHYTWIKADDIIGKKQYDSDLEMQRTIEWSDGLEALLVTPDDCIDYIGTRWRMDDVYAHQIEYYSHGEEEPVPAGPHAERCGDIIVFRREDIENGKPIFPKDEANPDRGGFTLEFFSRLMRTNPERYAAQYKNNPKAFGLASFQEEWIRWYDVDWSTGRIVLKNPEGPVETNINSMVIKVLHDPAVSDNKRTSSQQAMVACGEVNIDGILRIVLLRVKIGLYKPDEAVETIFEWDEELHPEFFSIEKYGYQGSIKYWLAEKAERERKPYPPILMYPPKGVGTAQKSKDERIKGLQPIFRAGQIYMHSSMRDALEQYIYYPRGKYRDFMDTLAQGVTWWEHSWEDAAKDDYEENFDEEAYLSRLGPDGYSLRRAS